ncbi:MAG: hypothetical protein LAO04_06200 [Acidobacteriia bacterium]|nr:hypothetical protein [Terriglobia bacterium]
MKILGLALIIVGWLIPVLALAFTSSNSARLILSLVGIGVTLVGILGVLNKAHLKHAIWKQ